MVTFMRSVLALGLIVAQGSLELGAGLATGSATTTQPSSDPGLDARWLDLVRRRSTIAAASGRDTQQPTSTISLHLQLTDQALAGQSPSPGRVEVHLERAGGTRSQFTVEAQPDGSGGGFYTAVLPLQVAPGDVVAVQQGALTTQLTVPALSAIAWDETDLLAGTAPALSTVTAYLYPFDQPSAVTQVAPVGSDGRYTLGFGGRVLRPRDTGYISWSPSPGSVAYTRYVTPFLNLDATSGAISGLGAPLGQGALTIRRDGLLVGQYAIRTDALGAFALGPFERYGLRPGDRIELLIEEQSTQLTLPQLISRYDAAGRRVYGQGVGGAFIEVWAFDETDVIVESTEAVGSSASVSGNAQGDGQFALPITLASRGTGIVRMTLASGHQISQLVRAPWINVIEDRSLGSGAASFGYTDAASPEVQVEVRDGQGELRDTRSTLVNGRGEYFFRTGSWQGETIVPGLAYQEGDQITVTAQGLSTSDVVPAFTVDVTQLHNGIVSGLGPASRPIQLKVFTETGTQVITGTTAPDGRFRLDLRAVGIPQLADSATYQIRLDVSATLSVSRWDRVVRPLECAPRLALADLGLSRLTLEPSSCPHGAPMQLQILAPGGGVRFTHVFSEVTRVVARDGAGNRLPLVAGDQIVLRAGEHVVTQTVPLLVAGVDRQQGDLSGWAGARQTLEIHVVEDGPPLTGFYAVQTEADGSFLAGGLLGRDGLAAMVRIQGTPFGHSVIRPGVSVHLLEQFVQAAVPAGEPVTVTVSLPGVLPRTTETVADEQGMAIILFDNQRVITPGLTVTTTWAGGQWVVTIPTLSAHIDPISGRVSGVAPPNGDLELYADLARTPFWRGTADPSGAYSIEAGSSHQVDVAWVSPSGARVWVSAGRTRLQVWHDTPCFQVLSGDGLTAFELYDGSRRLLDRLEPAQVFANACFSAPIESGDQIVAVSHHNQRVPIDVPQFSMALNLNSGGTVSGAARPNSPLSIYWVRPSEFGEPPFIPLETFELARLRTGPDGAVRYSLRWTQFALRTTLRVVLSDDQGNLFVRQFPAFWRHWLPTISR